MEPSESIDPQEVLNIVNDLANARGVTLKNAPLSINDAMVMINSGYSPMQILQSYQLQNQPILNETVEWLQGYQQ